MFFGSGCSFLFSVCLGCSCVSPSLWFCFNNLIWFLRSSISLSLSVDFCFVVDVTLVGNFPRGVVCKLGVVIPTFFLQCYDKNSPKFFHKTCWKEQPSIFTVCFINHIFQTSALIMECIELECIDCVNISKRSEAVNQPLLYWIEWDISLSLCVSLKTLQYSQDESR